MLAVLTPEPLDTSGPPSGFLGAETESTQLPSSCQGSALSAAAIATQAAGTQGRQGRKNGRVVGASPATAPTPQKQHTWPSAPSVAIAMSELKLEKADVPAPGTTATPEQKEGEGSLEDTIAAEGDREGIVTASEPNKLGASSSRMAIYVRLTEALADSEGDSETESSLGGSERQRRETEAAAGRTTDVSDQAAAGPSTQEAEVTSRHQHHQLKQAAVTNSERGGGDMVWREVPLPAYRTSRESELAEWAEREERCNSRPALPFTMPPVRRQGAMSDLWQHQGAFRSNQQSMKSMFEEFTALLESPENAGKHKAVIKDIFTFTSVGRKHLANDSPSEDRIAIHQAVVPTIDEETMEELGIDTIDTTPFAMFGVFDGHGGPACAEFLNANVSTVLAHSPVLYDEDLAPFQRRACATGDSFAELEKVHNDWATESNDLSGSTAILSTFQDGILVMAGVGDSAGLYVDHLGNSRKLCPQHSTSNAKEVARVLSMGGEIINGRVAGCLMPTRTIGDLDCKRALGDIVSPHPELKLAAIYAPPDDGVDHDEPFLVLASDGLWDVMSNGEVAHLARRGLRMLRVNQAKAKGKEAKAAAKADKKMSWKKRKPKSADASRNHSSRATSASASPKRTSMFAGGGLFGGPNDGGRSSSHLSAGTLDWSRGTKLGHGDFLDVSRNAGGLDASVRGGVGGPIASASLDASLYAGLRAQVDSYASTDYPHTYLGAAAGVRKDTDGVLPQKPVAVTSTAETASVRTVGSPSDNVAMQLVSAALRMNSKDDISVVVVTFERGPDKSPPGSRGAERRGSNSIAFDNAAAAESGATAS